MGLKVSSSKDSGNFPLMGKPVNESLTRKAPYSDGDTLEAGVSFRVDLSIQIVAPSKITLSMPPDANGDRLNCKEAAFPDAATIPQGKKTIVPLPRTLTQSTPEKVDEILHKPSNDPSCRFPCKLPIRSASAPSRIEYSSNPQIPTLQINLQKELNELIKEPPIKEPLRKKELTANEGISTFEEEIATLNRELKSLETYYDNWMNPINEFDNAQGFVLRYGKYIHANLDNFLKGIRLILNSTQQSQCESIVDFSDWIYTKLLAPLESFVFHAFKLTFDHQIEKELNKVKHKYYKLEAVNSSTAMKERNQSSELIAIHQRLNNLSEELFQDRALCIHSCKENSLKLLFNIVPLTIVMALAITGSLFEKCAKSVYKILKSIIEINNIAKLLKQQKEWVSQLKPQIFIDKATHSKKSRQKEQEKLQEDVQAFLSSLEECNSLKEVKKRLKKAGVNLELPTLFVEWQQLLQNKAFKRELVQSYYHSVNKRPFVSTEQFDSLLKKRKNEFSQKIDQFLPIVLTQIEECKDKTTLDEITQHFAKFNIFLNRLPLPPKDKAAWDQAASQLEFQQALAKQYVEYQESLGQLAEQAARQVLISENNMVRHSLIYDIFEQSLLIATRIIKIGLTVINPPASLVSTALECFLANLVKYCPALSFVAILYPEWTLKVFALFLVCLKHCYWFYKKPNEYSFEGYKLGFEIRWMQFVSTLHSLKSTLQKAQLWVTIHLIEKCILRNKVSPFKQDPRLIHIDATLKQQQDACSYQIGLLNHRVKELRALDINLNLFPNAGKRDSEIDATQTLPSIKMVSVKALEDALNEGNLDFFPESARQFIGKQLGIEITNENKEKIIASLKNLLESDEFDFVASFPKNRLVHCQS